MPFGNGASRSTPIGGTTTWTRFGRSSRVRTNYAVSLNLILDKSSFQQLNRDQHAECSRHFIDNVTPVLLREILGDLSKEAKPGTTSTDVVSSLARKFLGSGGPINHHYSVMCVGELNGNKVPIGHGQILPDN